MMSSNLFGWRKLFPVALLSATLLIGCGKPSEEELFQEGVQLLQQQNFVAARHRFQELVDNYPDSFLVANAKMAIGDCFNHEDRYDDARGIYSDLLKTHDNDDFAWMANVRLGDLSRVEEKWDDAVKYFEAAIEDTTDTTHKLRAMNNIAEAYMSQKKPDLALDQYKTMQAMTPNAAEKVQIAQVMTNYLFSQGRKEEAWAAITDVYDSTFTFELMSGYLLSVMQTAVSAGDYQKGFEFFDSKIDDTTEEEIKALTLYYKARLAAATDPTVATGVEIFKQVNQLYPKTVMGRWAPADAAVAILTASTAFSNPIEDASSLFAQALGNYDDIINDMTTEWWYPQKSAGAWRQVASIQQLRGLYMESVADLRAASGTHAKIVEKFKDYLPQVAQNSFGEVQRMSAMVHAADASPEYFWEQAKRARTGQPLIGEATQELSAEAIVPGTTGEGSAASEGLVPETSGEGK